MTDHKICKYKNKKIKGGAELAELAVKMVLFFSTYIGQFLMILGDLVILVGPVISTLGNEGFDLVIRSGQDAAPILMETGQTIGNAAQFAIDGAQNTMNMASDFGKIAADASKVAADVAEDAIKVVNESPLVRNTTIAKNTINNIFDGMNDVIKSINTNDIFKGWLKYERNKMIYGNNYNSFDLFYYNNIEPLSVRRHKMDENEVEKQLEEEKKKREEETSQGDGSVKSQEGGTSQEGDELQEEGDESQEVDKLKNTILLEEITNRYWGKNDATYLAICKMCNSYGEYGYSANQWVLVNEKGVNFFENTIDIDNYTIDGSWLGGYGLISLEEFVNEEKVDNIKPLFKKLLNSNPTVYRENTIKAKKLLIEFLKRYLHTFIEKMNAWEEKEKEKKDYIHSLYENKSYFGNDKYDKYIKTFSSDPPAVPSAVPPA